MANNQSINIDDLLDNASANKSSLIMEDNSTVVDSNGKRILGAVVDKAEYDANAAGTKKSGINISPIKSETIDSTRKYMEEMDQEIEKQRKIAEKIKSGELAPDPKNVNPEASSNKTKKEVMTPQEVIKIYIDKAQVGDVTFPEEIMKKMERTKKIDLVEVEKKEYKSIKIRRKDLKPEDKLAIIERTFDRTLSPFIALGSGYMGKMGNCSTADIMKLGKAIDSGRSLGTEIERWQLLYDKMKFCSIGKFESFDDFLKNTAYDDYESLQFALICASFPKDTYLSFECPQCKTNFTLTIPNKDFVRTDLVNEQVAETAKEILSAQAFVERAKEVHDNALFNVVTRISIDDDNDDVLLELYAPSAYDAIYRTYQNLTSSFRDDPNFEGYIPLIKFIKSAFICVEYDEDGDPVYDQYDDPDSILKVLSNMNETQMNKISTYMEESYLSHRYYYGLEKVECTNPKCKHNLGSYPMSMDTLLFHKVRPQ